MSLQIGSKLLVTPFGQPFYPDEVVGISNQMVLTKSGLAFHQISSMVGEGAWHINPDGVAITLTNNRPA